MAIPGSGCPTFTTTTCWNSSLPTGGGGGTGIGTGGTGGGGGGGAASGIPYVYPCLAAGQNLSVSNTVIPNCPAPGPGTGWVPAPFERLCSYSFNFRQGNDNSYWETYFTTLKFESSNSVNQFSAYYFLPNDISDAAMNTDIYPSPFGTGVPPKSPYTYLSEFFPELFPHDIQRIWDNSINSHVWRFSKYAAQKIANRCSNIASSIVVTEYPGTCTIPGHTLSQISFRRNTESFLKCFFPTTSTKCLPNPSPSSNTSTAIYSTTCN